MNLLEQFKDLSTSAFAIGINRFNLFTEPLTDITVKREDKDPVIAQMRIMPGVCAQRMELLPYRNEAITIHGIHQNSKELNKNIVLTIGMRGESRPTMAIKLCHIIRDDLVLENIQNHLSAEVSSKEPKVLA